MLSKPNERRNGTMKRLLISVLVAATVVGIFGTSLGAFTDAAGTKYSEAATVLSGLGILKGYEDGTFKPANTITRAEFSAVAVRAMGLESAAAVSAVATKFSDVPATHWAAGYINICSDQGIIKGYADGTFKPEAPVTYAEVLAMIIRMLGYDPSVTGTWPTNYIVKAYDIGLAGGVTFAAGAPATRGDVALFTQKALTLPMMVQAWTGAITSYVVDPDTSLLDKLGYTSYSWWVEDYFSYFGSACGENQVDMDGVLTIGAGVDFPPGWLGQWVKIWTDGDTIVAAVNKTASADIVTGVLLDWSGGEISVQVGSKEKTYADSSVFLARNNVLGVAANVGDTVRLVLDGGEVVSVIGWLYDDSAILTKVDTKYNKLSGVNSDLSDFAEDLDDYDAVVLEKDGRLTDIKGLAAGDLLYYAVDAGLNTFWGVVCSTKVTGKVESIDSDADGTSVTIGGKAYFMADPATYSEDGNKTILQYTGELDLGSFDGATATLYLDGAGDVRHISGTLSEAATLTKAVVKTEFFMVDNPDPEEADHYYVRLFKLDGTTVKLEVNTKTFFDSDATDAVDPSTGDPTEYDADWTDPLTTMTDLSGEFPIRTLVYYAAKDNVLTYLGTIPAEYAADTIDGEPYDKDYNTIALGSDVYRVGPSSLFIDYYNWKIRKIADFKTISIDAGPVPGDTYLNAAGNTIVYFVYEGDDDTYGITYGTKSENMGVVVGRQTTADGIKVKILVGDGKTVGYLVDSDTNLTTLDGSNCDEGTTIGTAVTELCSGDFVTFKVNGDYYTEIVELEYDDLTGIGADGGSGYVEDFDAEDLVGLLYDDPEDPGVEEPFTLALDCVFFDVSDDPEVAKASDVDTDQLVRVFDVDACGEYFEVFIIAG